VRHRVRGGRGVDRRGTGRRRQGRSPVVGQRETEQEEALVSEGRRGLEDGVARGRAGGGGPGGQHGVERSGGWATGGRAGRWDVQGRSVRRGARGRGGAPGSIGRLGPDDGSLVHHPR
jgi:hypothetical protein